MKEDKVDEKEDTQRMVRKNKRDSDEVVNDRSTHEVMGNDVEEHEECEEDDDKIKNVLFNVCLCALGMTIHSKNLTILTMMFLKSKIIHNYGNFFLCNF